MILFWLLSQTRSSKTTIFCCLSEALQAEGFHHQALRWSDNQRRGQYLRQSLAKEPDTCFGGGLSRRDKLCQTPATRKVCAAGCLFSRIARPADQHPENISGHAGMPLLVVVCVGKFGIVIQNFHFLIYYTQITCP